MLRKKISERLTARIFLLTALILLCAGATTFGLIAWATPSTYTAVVNDDLTRQVGALVNQLASTTLADSGQLLDSFIRQSGANAMLVGPEGNIVENGSQLAVQTVYEDDTMRITSSAWEDAACASSGGRAREEAVTVTMSEQATIAAEVQFSGETERYTLYVAPRMEAENLAVRALMQMAPWILLVLLSLSLLCAFVYSRYIARPIIRLSCIAGKMAELDFHWSCGETRRDEIGQLGRSLDEMSSKLSAALTELESANQALQGEVERERKREQQRTAFFNAASHELKTPLTILKGQLSGMLEGVGVYRERDKYLLRSLQTAGRMEALIQEMLAISRMEAGTVAVKQEPLDLAALVEAQLSLDAGLLEQREQHLSSSLGPGITIAGDAALLGKAVGNLLSNAALYSPEGAEIRVWCGLRNGSPALTIENTGTHIRDGALPHLFAPFYREEVSRSRSTGGSGLGLYLVKMILDRHGATCTIENTVDGVRATLVFPPWKPSVDFGENPC